MLKGLKRLAGGGMLLLELRGLRREMTGLRQDMGRIAAALEAFNAHQWPQVPPAVEAAGGSTEVSYASDLEQQELMQIELALTGARGIPPTLDEVVEEFELRHG